MGTSKAPKGPEPRLGQPVRVEHWVVARAMLGRAAPYTDVPFFWSQHHDATISVVGHLPRWDRIVIKGDLAKRDAVAAYYQGDRPLMVATIGRDHLGLEAEALLEKQDYAALSSRIDRA